MTIYFTADTHFRHSNIIEYCNRPFDSIENMNEAFIQRWNEKVDPGEHVFHLGDFGFGTKDELLEIKNKLNGKIFFIKGNHDKDTKKIQNKFEIFCQYHELNVKGYFESIEKELVLFHYPIEKWNKCHYGSIHLHGHQHSEHKLTGENRVDVGVDSWNYAPVSLFEIIELCESKEPVENPFEGGYH